MMATNNSRNMYLICYSIGVFSLRKPAFFVRCQHNGDDSHLDFKYYNKGGIFATFIQKIFLYVIITCAQ
jgi:hypothetical protein